MYIRIQSISVGVSLTDNHHYELCDDTTSRPRCQNCPIPCRDIGLVTTQAYALDMAGIREPLLVPKRTLILADYKRKTDSSIQSLKN